MGAEVLQDEHWDEQYRAGDAVWETERPCGELMRIVEEFAIRPCRALDIGCGSGVDAQWLAERGFDVTGVDLSAVAVAKARERTSQANFVAGDFTEPGVLDGRFEFFTDCGCYAPLRTAAETAYFEALERLIAPHGLGLVLTGNGAEPEHPDGPPVLSEAELRSEWSRGFEILQLRPFRWDAPSPAVPRFLGWSCVVRKNHK